MIDISIAENRELYTDYEKCLEFLREINQSDYEYPSEKVNFHVYSEIRNEKEQLCIDSYFATQNLDHTNLILWSDWDVRDNERLAPYKDHIDFRVYDPLEEAKGTVLEEHTEQLTATDSLYYLKSDLLRLLCCHKYGGIWIDMDIVLLRDFKPLLDQEYLYMWGSDLDFEEQGACATVMSTFKESEFSTKMLELLPEMPVLPNTTSWGKRLFGELWKQYKDFTIFPSVFFNTEWQINYKHNGLSQQIENGWFDNPLMDPNYLFLEAFSWHWHNTSFKHKPIVQGSKFDMLRNIMKAKLEVKGIK